MVPLRQMKLDDPVLLLQGDRLPDLLLESRDREISVPWGGDLIELLEYLIELERGYILTLAADHCHCTPCVHKTSITQLYETLVVIYERIEGST
jgi:hypothetical protein